MEPTTLVRATLIATLIATVALAASGCAAPRPQVGDLPSVVRGSTIIVHMRWPGDDPLPTAERYCAMSGRYPRPRTVTDYTVSYQCVAE